MKLRESLTLFMLTTFSLPAMALSFGKIPANEISVYVQDLDTGKVQIDHRSGVSVNPASTMKLVTAFAAFQALGKDYRWTTHFKSAAPIVGDTLNGDIYWEGSGDPVLDQDGLIALQQQLRDRGIRNIAGQLVLDRSLYDSAKPLDGVFHLTTLMCAKHRSQMLETIRGRLKNGEPCRVIATSLIEAGVDVDFPLVMRAEAGLDSVAQAAGRCNREGKRLTEESFVWIFQPEAQWKAPSELGLLSGVMRSVVRQHASDLLSVEAITDYFSEVYQLKGAELDQRRILAMHHNAGSSLNFPFQTIAAKFRMIETHMQPLIIPFDDEAERLIDSLRHADQIGGLLRKLQPYTVQIPESALDALLKAGRIEAINEHTFGKQFYSLIGLDLYDEVAGLSWEDVVFLRAEGLVF